MKAHGLSELQAIVAVARHRSFRGAASSLGISPSAVSHAVSALEDRFKVRLFSRTTRSVMLTSAGEAFLAKAQPGLDLIADAMESMNRFRDEPTGTLRLNASAMAARQILEPLILAYSARYPDVAVEVVTEGRLVDIVAGGFDAGVRIFETLPLDMVALPIGGDQRHMVVGSPEYFSCHSRPEHPKELVNHACIRFRLPGGALYRWEFERGGERFALDVGGPLTLDDADLALEAAISSAGLAYAYSWAARKAIAGGDLVEVLADWTPAYPGLHLYYPRHRHPTAALRALSEMIRQMDRGSI